jgi:putative hydrolase of the HAD superfamily
MARVSLLLWDVGGVVLTDGFDEGQRARTARHFGIDPDDLERRHLRVVTDFETGKLSLADYLAAVVFHEPRSFTPEAFADFVRSCSAAHEEALACARALRRSGRYLMATLNNESRELNEYRITSFRLREAFQMFLTSCYTGRRKPDPAAYEYALALTQHAPEEVVFLDDRPENVGAARRLGLQGVHVRDPARVADDLGRVGVRVG